MQTTLQYLTLGKKRIVSGVEWDSPDLKEKAFTALVIKATDASGSDTASGADTTFRTFVGHSSFNYNVQKHSRFREGPILTAVQRPHFYGRNSGQVYLDEVWDEAVLDTTNVVRLLYEGGSGFLGNSFSTALGKINDVSNTPPSGLDNI